MRVFVAGNSGLLAQYLQECKPPSVDLVGCSRSGREVPGYRSAAIDLAQEAQLRRVFDDLEIDIVINAAAEGSVDAVEGKLAEYGSLNVEMPKRLAELCSSNGIRFVHISSNAVYSDSGSPITEDSIQDPLNDYGRLKVAAERAVLAANSDAFIVRPIMMYGWPLAGQRSNPVTHWVSEVARGNEVHVVTDVYTQPLAARDCAAAIWAAIDQKITGSLNVGGGALTSLYSLAEQTVQAFDLPAALVHRATSSDFPGLAPRPHRVEFDLTRLNSLGIYPMDVSQGLAWLRNSASLQAPFP